MTETESTTALRMSDPNLYGALHAIRSHCPVSLQSDGSVLVSDYGSAVRVLRDFGKLDESLESPVRALRPLLSRSVVAAAVPRIRSLAARLVDDCILAGTFDAVADLAYPLTVDVICDLLGVPDVDRDEVRPLARELAPLFDTSGPEVVAATESAHRRFADYFRTLLRQRRRRGGHDGLSGLTRPQVVGMQLSDDEILDDVLFLFLAGQETTMNLIANGLCALATCPDQWQRLRADRGLIRSAVEEFLRYDSPLQRNVRFARHDTTLSGEAVPAGTAVSVLVGAANRDPARFDDPDRLDVSRARNAHASFGFGQHHCFGAGLARTEAQAVLAACLTSMERIELSSPVQWRPLTNFRGPEAVWLTVAPARL